MTTQAPPRTGPRIHRAWFVAAVTLGALVAAAGVPLLDRAPCSSRWRRSSAGRRATTSGAVTLNLVVYGLTAPFAAALMERFGVRRVVAHRPGPGRRRRRGLTLLMTAAWQLWLLWGVAVGVGTGVDGARLRRDRGQPLVRDATAAWSRASSRRPARPGSWSSCR